MMASKIAAVLALAIVAMIMVSGGSAQQDSVGDLGLAARQDDLDSYWLDTRVWAEYGYRPYAKVHTTRFMSSLPSNWTGRTSYSWGMNSPSTLSAPWEGGPSTGPVQLTKYGTWH
jgi:hypothetical protein